MLKRKMMQRLLDWKNNKNSECLLVKGARQTGKTFIIDHFARENYGNVIAINFEETPALREVFDGDLSVPEMMKRMSLAMQNIQFVPNDTLIFLDEIQACPQARTSLKFWAMDNRFDVIATGSLLGINYKEVSSYPVGYEMQIEMHALDFEEFLWAIGIEDGAIQSLREYFEKREKVPPAIHTAMMKYLREYMAVGGMPAVVNRYLETNNFNEVHLQQQRILDSYLDDIAKYADTNDKPKARNCYLSIPRQLAKEYRKFQFSVVERGGNARKYGNSLEWLRDANLIRFCRNVATPEFPLPAYIREDQYKLYLNDIGLLIALYGFDMKKAIVDDTLTGHAKSGIYENLVADMLLKRGEPLCYYKPDNSTQEIEFLLTRDANIIPVEVKSKNGPTISLNEMLKRVEIPYAYKLISGNVGVTEKKITLPLYMGMFV